MAKKRQNKNQKNDQAPEQDIIQEAGLPSNWQPIDVEPVIPSAPKPGTTPPLPNAMPSHFVGTLNPDMQHDAKFVGTEVASPRIASTPLMPVAPSGNPQTNAAIRSIISINQSKSTVTSAGMNFQGVWNSFQSYNVNDVVLFNTSAYVAITGSVNLQPDLNTPTNWTLLSENFVFNPTVGGSFGPGWGPFDKQVLNTNPPNSATPFIGPLTPSTVGEIAFLGLTRQQADLNTTGSGWVEIDPGDGQWTIAVKPLPTTAVVQQTLNTANQTWAANLLLFKGSWTASSLTGTITSVQITSNVVTCQCVNSFINGTQVTFSGLTGASFLNGQTVTLTAVTGTSFTANFTHANYGPTADNGTATNLPYLQKASDTFYVSPKTISLTNPVTKGNTLVLVGITSDTNAVCKFATVTDNLGNVWTIFNDTQNGAQCSIAYTQNAIAGSTTVTINGTPSAPSDQIRLFELPAASSLTNWLPYDVAEFRGSIFVCISETSLDAFGAPTKWALIGPATGFTQVKTANYMAVQGDEGNLLAFNSSSAVTLTLPNPLPSVSGQTDSGWYINVENIGSGALTISPNGLNLDGGSASLILNQNQGCLIFTDGSNFFTVRGAGSSAGGVNSQTVNYTAVRSDNGKLISFNGSNLTLTLPNPAISTTWFTFVENLNSTNLTISPNGLNIDGSASSLTLGQNQGIIIFTDGTNYFTEHGVSRLTVPSILIATVPDGSGNVTLDLATQAANTGLYGPASGAAAKPTFRLQVPADLPGYVFVKATGAVSSASGTLRPGGGIASAGTYRVSIYMVVTANPSAGSLDVNIGWNDGTAARTATNGTNGMPANISTAATNFAQGQTIVEADGINDITWAFTLT